MFLYTVLTIPAAILFGLLLAVRTKPADGISYGKLDKISRITNIILIPVYVLVLPFPMFLGMVSAPLSEGILGMLGWIVSVLIASPALFCGIGLGASSALRKKGKGAAGFAVQFAGAAGILLSFVLYAVMAGKLLQPLN